MADRAAHPVFIFLPVEEGVRDEQGLAVDPVCGRALAPGQVAGRLLHGGRHHYFCSLACAEKFASEPTDFDTR